MLVSFLHYGDFAAPFPVLAESLAVDLATGTHRWTDYRHRGNPPVLHRKELLLPAEHPLVPEAAQRTRRLAVGGAFAEPSRIGTREGWLRALSRAGLSPEDREPVGL